MGGKTGSQTGIAASVLTTATNTIPRVPPEMGLRSTGYWNLMGPGMTSSGRSDDRAVRVTVQDVVHRIK